MAKCPKYQKLILKVCDHHHLNADQILVALREYYPDEVSTSTVYRNIQQLVETGELKEAGIFDGKRYYEKDIGTHAHLIDTKTGEIRDVEFPQEIFDAMPAGFIPERVCLQVYGSQSK